MGGLIKWLKKDGTTRVRRRDSAPFQLFRKQKPSSEETIRDSLNRFVTFREHDRIQRLSMGANDLSAYHSILSEMPDDRDENSTLADPHHTTYQGNMYPPKSCRIKTTVEDKSCKTAQNGHRTKKVSVQFHLDDSTDDTDFSVDYRKSRHSMPAMASNTYSRGIRRTQNFIDSKSIREEAIDEFEEEHCMYSDSVNDMEQSSYRSPPMKFYKQNQNPYPNNSETSSLSTVSDVHPMLGKCPEKPKRLLLNSKQSRKLLTEAHFTGAYRNYEIQSPYYSDSSSLFSTVDKTSALSTDTENYKRETSSPLEHYQVTVNKHGDEVEYALPCVEIPQHQRRQNLPNCLTSDDSIMADEVFQEDPKECIRMLEENYEMTSNTSIYVNEHTFERRKKGSIQITDLDKSTDTDLDRSTHTVDEMEVISRGGRANSQMRTPNRLLQFHETMQCADIICLISEFNSMGKMEAKIETPLHFEWGVFKNSNVTVRKYADLPSDDTNKDFTLIAETAIIRDAEVLRKIRHPNVINLMAIAFEPFRRLALIMEPTKYSLNHHLFVKNEQLDLIEVVTVVKRIAGAVSYLQEFGICHSNLSSHAILVGDNVTHVKLTSFELAVPYRSDIQEEVELKAKQKLKRTPPIRSKTSPKKSLSSEQKIERYKQITTETVGNNIVSDKLGYCVPFIREISTKYFPYTTEYRRKLAIYNYQAPELLSQTEPFVFPTKQSDTYALTLLLWECLNQCIPFVIYDEVKLDELLKTNYPLKYLPIVEEERCQRFHEILERGLKREPDTRIELEKMIRKLDAIEVEIQRENEKDQGITKCCCLKLQSGKSSQRRSLQNNAREETIGRMTPDRSTSKLFSLITSPKPSPVAVLSTNSIEKTLSPLNNVSNNTFYNSMLDFNKLLSPKHDTNDQRSSTLKKRKKFTPTKTNKLNVRDLFGDDVANGRSNDELKATSVYRQDSEPLSSGRPSNEFNKALTKSAIFKELDETNEHDDEHEQNHIEPNQSINVPAKKKVEQPFGPKEVSNSNDTDFKQLNENNSSYRFIIDDYELPQQIIARNNKIRRCTWLSSDQVNGSMRYEPLSAASSKLQSNNDNALSTLNESQESNKKMNVSIKIVHKQLTPGKNMVKNDTTKFSDCSTVSALSAGSSEDSFSVKSRIKFFRSLECQPVQRRTPNKSKINISRRSEMSFYEAKKAIEKSQRHTYPTSHQSASNPNQYLLKEIGQLAADLKDSLSKNKYLNEIKPNETEHNEDEINNLLNAEFSRTEDSLQLLIDGLLDQKSYIDENTKNESCNEETEKRNSVRETVQKFESSMRNEKNDHNFSVQKVENKLLNEKIFNSDSKSGVKKAAIFFGNKMNEVTDEKVEDVMRIVAPSEVENEAAAQIVPDVMDTPKVPDTDNQQSQTLIKRTFYQESIVSGTNVDVPELQTLLTNTPSVSTAYSTTRKSSLTTRVTLNMRKSRRRSSDAGLIAQQSNGFTHNGSASPGMTDVRHSICGSPAPILFRQNSVDATSGRKLEQMTGDRYAAHHASNMMISNDQLQTSVSSVLTGIFNGKSIQSIEDLYIDDDFGGIGLAANMKLMTNSTDSLDNINFDLISTHIFEQTSESTMTTNTRKVNTNTNAIEAGDETDNETNK